MRKHIAFAMRSSALANLALLTSHTRCYTPLFACLCCCSLAEGVTLQANTFFSPHAHGPTQADLQPGGPNLILIAELLPSPSTHPQTQPQALSSLPTQPSQPTDRHAPSSQGPSHNHKHQPGASATDALTLPPPPPCPSAGLAPGTSNAQAPRGVPQHQPHQPYQPQHQPHQPQHQPLGVPQHQGSVDRQVHGAGAPAVDTSLGYTVGTEAEAAVVVGLACGCCVAGCEASLTNLAVCPSLRGRGLGGRLATELLRRLGWVAGS